ncbi:hypothetical protein VTO42DRAFT_5386 [Malbranchea cinnamomea]
MERTPPPSVRATASAQQAPIANLPSNLLPLICEYLPISSVAALAYTCSSLYVKLATNRLTLRDNVSEKTAFLVMLEREGRFDEYFCRGCLKLHSRGNFSVEEFQKLPTERSCMYTLPTLRVTPGFDMSFEELRHQLVQQWFGTLGPVKLRKGVDIYRRTTKGFELIDWFTKWSRRFNIPICTHLRLHDLVRMVLCEHDKTARITELCICRRWSNRFEHCAKCLLCSTSFHLNIKNEQIRLAISRDLGHLWSPFDPTYVEQLAALNCEENDLLVYWRNCAFLMISHIIPDPFPDNLCEPIVHPYSAVLGRADYLRSTADREKFYRSVVTPTRTTRDLWQLEKWNISTPQRSPLRRMDFAEQKRNRVRSRY